ncbi:MAG: hypothetical protein U0871_19380 [Gemmataceae bacterium]
MLGQGPAANDPEVDPLLAWHAEHCRAKQRRLEEEWSDTWRQLQAAEAAGDQPDWVAYLAGQLELRRLWLAENAEWAGWLAGRIAQQAVGRLARLGTVSGW